MLQIPTEEHEWVLDIETLGLDGCTYPVISVGIMGLETEELKFWELPEVSKLGNLQEKEEGMLIDFSAWVREKGSIKIIGYNSNAFDIPFLRRRYFKYGMQCPRFAYTIDLCKILEGSFGLKYHRRLSDWCSELNYERPTQFYGSDVPKLYLEGNMEEIKKHNTDDLKVTAFLYKRCKETGLL